MTTPFQTPQAPVTDPLFDCETAGGPSSVHEAHEASVAGPCSDRGRTMGVPWKDHESAVPQPPESHLHYRNEEERQLHRKMHLSARSGRGRAISLGTAEAGTGGHAVRVTRRFVQNRTLRRAGDNREPEGESSANQDLRTGASPHNARRAAEQRTGKPLQRAVTRRVASSAVR
jgi:hypothetical protein